MKRRAKRTQPTRRKKPSAAIATTAAIHADEKRGPLALVFYDGERDKLNFDRLNGVDLEEFAAIMARLFPRWLEGDFQGCGKCSGTRVDGQRLK